MDADGINACQFSYFAIRKLMVHSKIETVLPLILSSKLLVVHLFQVSINVVKTLMYDLVVFSSG